MKWRNFPVWMPRRPYPFWTWRFEFKRQDLWVGAYWEHRRSAASLDVWVCLVPMLPLHVRGDGVPF